MSDLPTVCPACGFRLDIDHRPCVLCNRGWAYHSLHHDGTSATDSCEKDCLELRLWRERQAVAARKDKEAKADA